MVKISIISPVYNVEKYLVKGIESVLKQSFSDYELILIDDGSTDGSAKICDDFCMNDSRIKVIHQKNQGSSSARNRGLEIAEGKYIYFMDADDWIEPGMLGNLVLVAERNNAELVITGFKMEYYINGRSEIYTTTCPDKTYESVEYFRKEAYRYFNKSLLSLPWNKLFLGETIRSKKLRFKTTKWPDHHFCMDYLMDCESVVLSSITDYHWVRSRNSSSTMLMYADVAMFEKRTEHFKHILELYEHWNISDDESIEGINAYYIGRVVQCIQELVINNQLTKEEKTNKIREILSNSLVRSALCKLNSVSKTMKIMILPLKYKSLGGCFVLGRTTDFVRNVFPEFYVKLKEREVHEVS